MGKPEKTLKQKASPRGTSPVAVLELRAVLRPSAGPASLAQERRALAEDFIRHVLVPALLDELEREGNSPEKEVDSD